MDKPCQIPAIEVRCLVGSCHFLAASLMLTWIMALPAIPAQEAVAKGGMHRSPLGLAIDHAGQRAYVALHTANAVGVVDLKAGTVLREIPVGRRPFDVALSGESLFVSCEHDDTLVRIDLKKHAVTGHWKMPQGPRGVAALVDGSRVFVACHDDRSFATIDVASGKMSTIPAPGWPERVALDGGPAQTSLLGLSTGTAEAMLSQFDIKMPSQVKQTMLLAGASNPRGFAGRGQALLPAHTLVVHQRPRTHVPATQISQGWVFTNALGALSLEPVNDYAASGIGPKVLDEPNRGYADPSDVVVSPLNDFAFVAAAGADTVLALRPGPLRQASEEAWASRGGSRDLTSSRHFVAARLSTQANPRRLALSGDGKVLVTANYLGDSLTVIDAANLRIVHHIALGGPKPDAARCGEILFNSNKMTFHGQFTCASCHPDGGADGLNWDLSRDGIGNPMNTRSLLGIKDTAPYGWLGNSPTLADRVGGTLRTLHHHEPKGTEAEDMVAYLKTLEAPRPLPQKGVDPKAVARGQAIFQSQGKCMNCHRRQALDDDVAHDVGTRVLGDHQDQFDTPSLRGVARTAPYLHHGQAKTLEEIFSRYNPRHRHGAAHRLTAEELADLMAYLRNL
jgi:YVTN family beta-propeller protein